MAKQPRPLPEAAYFTTAQLSAYTGIPVETLRYHRKRGQLTGPLGFLVGRQVLYPKKAVDALLEDLANQQG